MGKRLGVDWFTFHFGFYQYAIIIDEPRYLS